MGKYSGLARSALRLIEKKGSPGLLTGISGVTYDPVTQAASGAPPSVPVKVVRRSVGSGRTPRQTEGFSSGSLVAQNIADFVIAMQGVAMLPEAGMTLTVAGIVWKIVWADIADPASDGPIIATVRVER